MAHLLETIASIVSVASSAILDDPFSTSSTVAPPTTSKTSKASSSQTSDVGPANENPQGGPTPTPPTVSLSTSVAPASTSSSAIMLVTKALASSAATAKASIANAKDFQPATPDISTSVSSISTESSSSKSSSSSSSSSTTSTSLSSTAATDSFSVNSVLSLTRSTTLTTSTSSSTSSSNPSISSPPEALSSATANVSPINSSSSSTSNADHNIPVAGIVVASVLGFAALLGVMFLIFRYCKPVRRKWDLWQEQKRLARTYRSTLDGPGGLSEKSSFDSLPKTNNRSIQHYYSNEPPIPKPQPTQAQGAGLGIGSRLSLLRQHSPFQTGDRAQSVRRSQIGVAVSSSNYDRDLPPLPR